MKFRIDFNDGKYVVFPYKVEPYAEKGLINFFMEEGSNIADRWREYYDKMHVESQSKIKITVTPSELMGMSPYVLILSGHSKQWEDKYKEILIRNQPELQKKFVQIAELFKEFSPKLLVFIMTELANPENTPDDE